MRVTHKGLSFKKNDKWVTCPRCKFDYHESEMVEEWTGKKVCPRCVDDPPEAKSKSSKY